MLTLLATLPVLLYNRTAHAIIHTHLRYTYTSTHTFTQMYTRKHKQTCTQIHTRTHIQIHTYTHTNTHTRVLTQEHYTEKADVWSLGCVVYHMMMLRPPFDGSNPLSVASKIVEGSYEEVSMHTTRVI